VKKKKRKILLSFTGNHDPYSKENESLGPILSIINQEKYDVLCLLYDTAEYLIKASAIKKYCQTHFPELTVRYFETPIYNPIEYNLVYPAMYQSIKEITQEYGDEEYTVSVTSGTPTMHSCWLFMAKGGILNARLIQISRESGISEITFDLDDFPEISQPMGIKAQMTRLNRENRSLRNHLEIGFEKLIGEHESIKKIKKQIQICSQYDIPVLIQGETGTGKELAALALHSQSLRKEKPFIAINCGAISPNLFESEFFGHKKGAFTGAVQNYEGKFLEADGGTLFLDEIGDLPLEIQVKLLRVLQEGSFFPVGSNEEKKVNVRIISASHKNLIELVREKGFREDLYYRIARDIMKLPPLRERGNDIILISEKIMKNLNNQHRQIKKLTSRSFDKLLTYDWPGNIRELQSVLETAFIYSEENIEEENIRFIASAAEKKNNEINIPIEGIDLDGEVIPSYYQAAIEAAEGNKEQAAKLLKLKPHTFRARLRKLKFDD